MDRALPSLFVIFMLVGGGLVVGGLGAVPDQERTDTYSYSVYNASGDHSLPQPVWSYDADRTFDYANLSATGQEAFSSALGGDGEYAVEGEAGRAPEFRFYTDELSSYIVRYQGHSYEVVTYEQSDDIATGGLVALVAVPLGFLLGLCGLLGGTVDVLLGDREFALQQAAPAVTTVLLLLVLRFDDPIPSVGGWVANGAVGVLVFAVTTALLWWGAARLDAAISESSWSA